MAVFALCDMLGLAHVNPRLYLSLNTKLWYKQVIVEVANVKVGGGVGSISK